MNEVFGDLWKFDGIIAITTNGFVRTDRTYVMGRGCARQAAVRFPELPRKLASRLSAEGNHVFYFSEYRLIHLPGKAQLVGGGGSRSHPEIRKRTAQNHRGKKDQGSRLPPRPGCGNGRLKWEDVKKSSRQSPREINSIS
jgi:hypothetical protein